MKLSKAIEAHAAAGLVGQVMLFDLHVWKAEAQRLETNVEYLSRSNDKEVFDSYTAGMLAGLHLALAELNSMANPKRIDVIHAIEDTIAGLEKP